MDRKEQIEVLEDLKQEIFSKYGLEDLSLISIISKKRRRENPHARPSVDVLSHNHLHGVRS